MMLILGSSWLFSVAGWLQSLSSAIFSSLALLCDCSACIHQQFKGCSLKFVLYHTLLLHLTWFCRRRSKRKLHLKSNPSFLVFTPLFPSGPPSKVFSLYTGKGKGSFFLQPLTALCFVLFGFYFFFITSFQGVFWLSVFHPMLKEINKNHVAHWHVDCKCCIHILSIYFLAIFYQY